MPTKVYAEALDWPDGSPLATSARRAEADPELAFHQWDVRHNVMHDGPERVLGLLLSIS